MQAPRLTILTLALAAAYSLPAQADTNEELQKELRALKDRVSELEKKLTEAPADKQWGMTPEQVREFNRISVKTEALEDAQEAQGLKMLKIGGYVDPVYVYNQRQRRAGFQFLNRVSDDGYRYDNGYFGIASLDFQKEMDGGVKWHLTLMPNRGAGAIFDGNSIVHEASISIPMGDLQTRFIAGQIPDWSGYEYPDAPRTKFITRGLLLDFTEPTAYTGAGVDIVSGKWEVKGVLANMNASKRAAHQQSPVLAYRVDYSKGEFNGFGFAGVHGKAANFTENVVDTGGNVVAQPDSRLDLFEADGYFIRGDLTLQGQIGLGRQKYAAITPAADGSLQDARWWGISGLAGYKFTPRLEGALRADYIRNNKNGGGLLGFASADDRNGIGPAPTGDANVGANRWALAIGASYVLTTNTSVRAEYRLDGASQPVFLDVKTGEYRKTNQLLGTSVVVNF